MSSLQKRVLSGVVMLNVFGGALLFDPEFFIVLVLLVGFIASYEWLFLVMPHLKDHAKNNGSFANWVMVIMAGFAVLFPSLDMVFDIEKLPFLSTDYNLDTAFAVKLSVAAFFTVLIWSIDAQIMKHKCTKEHGRSRQFMSLGLIYIALFIASLLWLYKHENHSEFLPMSDGVYLTLFVCSMVWATDICAYFIGKIIGGPKMAPKISPNKTISGLFGGMLGAAIVAVVFALPHLRIGIFDSVPLYLMAIMGALLAVVGQIGDVTVSALKRRYNVKDTGKIIPGHGGILDRIDGLLLVSIVFTIIVMVLETV